MFQDKFKYMVEIVGTSFNACQTLQDCPLWTSFVNYSSFQPVVLFPVCLSDFFFYALLVFVFVLFCLASFNTSLYYGYLWWCYSAFMVADLTNMLFHYSWLSFVLFCLEFDSLHCFVEVVWTVFVKLIYVLFEFHPALYHCCDLCCIIVCLVFNHMSQT